MSKGEVIIIAISGLIIVCCQVYVGLMALRDWLDDFGQDPEWGDDDRPAGRIHDLNPPRLTRGGGERACICNPDRICDGAAAGDERSARR